MLMVDLGKQYQKIKTEIDDVILNCIESTNFINGPEVKTFEESLSNYLNVKHVIACANGTDALQIAMMALGLKPGDEVICPAFTYIATVEVIALLGLVPILISVDSETFNLDSNSIESKITSRTRAIVPVHLYGQTCQMETIMNLAKKYNLFVIEDNAQSLGSSFQFSNGLIKKAGTIGHIGTTSFFPSKVLGCFGDGGALFTDSDEIAEKIRMISNHGQNKKYYHKLIGCNSRLDTIQAAILNIKLKYLNNYIDSRQNMAKYYDNELVNVSGIALPTIPNFSTHVFHQYTIKVYNTKRDSLKNHLLKHGIPTMVYYPLPVYKQEAFVSFFSEDFKIQLVENLSEEVLSLPIHTEQNLDEQKYICDVIKNFFEIHG
jgi:dTDP-4-amino-4,6-dideoxygalactose transaminase